MDDLARGCGGVSWVDALAALALAVAGTLAVAAIPGLHSSHSLLTRDYLSHAWLLLVALGWYFGLRRRLPLGRLDPRALAPWFPVWAGLGGIVGVLALMSRSPVAGVTVGPLGIVTPLGFQGLFVGPSEELLFRGLVQTGLNNSLGRRAGVMAGAGTGIRPGTLVAALLFGALHLGVGLVRAGIGAAIGTGVVAFALALVLGHSYDRTGNVWGAAPAHDLVDLLGTAVPMLVS